VRSLRAIAVVAIFLPRQPGADQFQRLGAKPLELLFDLRRGALASTSTPGAFAFGLRLVAWDGTGLDAADTPANAAAFGATQSGNPQLRLLALTECGTHALIDAVFDGVEKGGNSSRSSPSARHCARSGTKRPPGIDPDRISFTVTVRIARDHASSQAGIRSAGSSRARSQAIRDILGDLLQPRRNRQCERVKKPPKNTFAAKKRDGIHPPGTVRYKIKVTRKASLPAGTP
jgi:hypothetical protein